MNVLVIPEDFRQDQYVLRPIIKAIFRDMGKPANVRILMDPLLGGIEQAMNITVLRDDILARYRMVHLFLLLVDRDAREGRREKLLHLEQSLCAVLPMGRCFLAECAYEELEVWALAGASLPASWRWNDVRTHPHPKEAYFEPFAAQRGLLDEPGAGRDTLGAEAAARVGRVMQLCPEVAHLQKRIGAYLATAACGGEPYAGA
jgi:hypothetical protein